jgi:alcohol dehydrogenase
LRHYAGLLGPAGATASRIIATDHQLARAQRLWSRRPRPRLRRQRGLVVGPGGRIGWKAVPEPQPPGARGAIVHPIAMATCDMDRPIMLARTPFPLPLHLGHECVAEVVSVGPEVQRVRPGDRVVVPFQINCGHCEACRLGRTGNCTGVPALSMYGFGAAGGLWGGAIADLLGVPFADEMLVALPRGVDPQAAASVGDNVSDAYRHIAPHLPGVLASDSAARVVILASLTAREPFTAGMPIYTGMVALALGAPTVEFVDARASVRELAARLGMHPRAPRELGRIEPAALVVDVTANPGGLREALRMTAPDGICTSAGGLHAHGRMPLLRSYIRNLTLHVGRTHARAVMPEVLELIASGRLRPEAVTTRVASLEDAPAALREHCREGALKTVLLAS